MMLPTHILVGISLISPLILLYPEYATQVIVFSAIGSTIPDFDLFIGQHRRTLHRSVYVLPLIVILGILTAIMPTMITVSSLALAVSFCIHPILDFVGGGLSREPWNDEDDQTVYDHYRGVWRYHSEAPISVKYDGSPYDLTLASFLGLYLYLFTEYSVVLLPLIITSVFIGGIYTAIRKYLPKVEKLMYEHIPQLRPFIDSLHGED